jgi:hypothetical protein
MATAVKVARRGRPNKFTPLQIRSLKQIVRAYGLREGQKALKEIGIEISLPTLAKYISTDVAGKPIHLKRGRPAGSGKFVAA